MATDQPHYCSLALLWSFLPAKLALTLPFAAKPMLHFLYEERYEQKMNVKTGISIDRNLAEKADALAREMGVTRSGLYAMAVREFVRRHENESLLQKLNDVYEDPDSEDEPVLRGIKRHGRRLLDE
jgi:hypothetical protein